LTNYKGCMNYTLPSELDDSSDTVIHQLAVQCEVKKTIGYHHLTAILPLQIKKQRKAGKTEQATGCLFDMLPDEVVVHLFSFLPSMLHLATATLVCRRWRELAFEDELWEKFFFSRLASDVKLEAEWAGSSTDKQTLRQKVIQRGGFHVTLKDYFERLLRGRSSQLLDYAPIAKKFGFPEEWRLLGKSKPNVRMVTILFVGDSAVGKTSTLIRSVYSSSVRPFPPFYRSKNWTGKNSAARPPTVRSVPCHSL
jgi:hypothetical protein